MKTMLIGVLPITVGLGISALAQVKTRSLLSSRTRSR